MYDLYYVEQTDPSTWKDRHGSRLPRKYVSSQKSLLGPLGGVKPPLPPGCELIKDITFNKLGRPHLERVTTLYLVERENSQQVWDTCLIRWKRGCLDVSVEKHPVQEILKSKLGFSSSLVIW